MCGAEVLPVDISRSAQRGTIIDNMGFDGIEYQVPNSSDINSAPCPPPTLNKENSGAIRSAGGDGLIGSGRSRGIVSIGFGKETPLQPYTVRGGVDTIVAYGDITKNCRIKCPSLELHQPLLLGQVKAKKTV